jgi:LysR family glycine cleavage system transcriptional activator
MRLPSLNQLRTFQLAGRQLSFKGAAEELAITPSAVSHQIRKLESFLGIALFVRGTRSLELTDAGRNYFNFLDGMFARLENETQLMLTRYGRSIVRLCVPPFFASEALLPRLSDYQLIAQDTDIRVSTQPSAMKVHPPEADLSVLLGANNWPNLVTYRLMARKVVVACAASLKTAAQLDSYESLNGQTLIVHENRPEAWRNWADWLGIPLLKPRKLIRLDSMSAVVRAAEQGLGIALVSWPLGKACFESGALVRLFEDEMDTGERFYLAHRPEDAGREEVNHLVQWLLREFREDA